MRFGQLQGNWDAHGRSDPMWAILTDPAKQGNRWDAEEFFATGRKDVDELLARADALGLRFGRTHALDFGCGVGRLSQALADHFEHVTGVDIAPSMIARARALNRRGARCEYMVNNAPDLARFADGTFDLVFSHITLQHVRPEYSLRYVAEFVRVLRPDGLCVFQLPGARVGEGAARAWVRARLPGVLSALRRLRARGGPIIEMYTVPRERVDAAVRAAGGRVAHALDERAAAAGYEGFIYFVRRA